VDCYRGDEEAIGFWLALGGRSTLAGLGIAESVIDAPDKMPLVDELRSRLSPDIVDLTDRLPPFWSLGDYFFVHAVVRPVHRWIARIRTILSGFDTRFCQPETA